MQTYNMNIALPYFIAKYMPLKIHFLHIVQIY